MYDQPIKCYLSRAFRCGIAVMSQKSEMSVGFFYIRRMRLCFNKTCIILYQRILRSFIIFHFALFVCGAIIVATSSLPEFAEYR